MKHGKLTPEEAHWLDMLYLRANEDDNWDMVKVYYRKLATKYHFDMEKVFINKMGEIIDLEYCYKCGDLATRSDGTNYVKDNNEAGKMINFAICNVCEHKFFPEKAYEL